MNFQLRPALTLFVTLSVVTGLVYPLAVTGVAQLVFPDRADGSLIARDGAVNPLHFDLGERGRHEQQNERKSVNRLHRSLRQLQGAM